MNMSVVFRRVSSSHGRLRRKSSTVIAARPISCVGFPPRLRRDLPLILTSASNFSSSPTGTGPGAPGKDERGGGREYTTKKQSVDPGTAGQMAYDLRRSLDEGREGRERSPCMETILAHAGLEFEGGGICNDPLSPPLELATTWERPPNGDYHADGASGRVYSRTDNPTRESLEETVARLEVAPQPHCHNGNGGGGSSNAADVATTGSDDVAGSGGIDAHLPMCSAFSSGMAAVAAILLAHPADCAVVLPDDCYHGVPTQLLGTLARRGIAHSSVDMTDHDGVLEELERVLAAQRRGRHDDGGGGVILWLETPSNPLTKVTDVGGLCRSVGETFSRGEAGGCVTIVVDATWSTPLITQPILLGADAVLHSGTKYFGGHSDLTLGLVISSPLTPAGRWLGPAVRRVQTDVGAIASPFDCWLCLRGLRSLAARLDRQCRTAMELALFLEEERRRRPFVRRVHYPGLPSHPQHRVARRQMAGGRLFGGMLSFETEDEATAMAVAGAVRVIKRATSLGGTETLIEHRASIEPPDRVTSPPGLLRLSVGLEDVDDLKRDLELALDVARAVMEKTGS